MLRITLLHLVLFLLPFMVYGFYLYMGRGKSAVDRSAWVDAPTFWLAVAGLVCVAVGFVSLAVFTGDDLGTVYRPAAYVDGELVPGGIEPAE